MASGLDFATGGLSSAFSGGGGAAGFMSGLDFLDITGGKSAAKRAAAIAKAQSEAYDKLKGVSTADMDKAALEQAKKNYLDQMGFLKEYSPGAHEAYRESDKALGEGGKYATTATHNAAALADASYAENADHKLAGSEAEAARQSEELLKLGGSLSPEMQAELMRAGFATGASVGGTAGSEATRSGMARQLASDVLKMQQTRQNMAGNLQNQAETIRQSRNANINAALTTASAPGAIASGYANAANHAATTRTPQGYGVGGDQAADNYTQNINLENEKTLGKAGVETQRITANSKANRMALTAGTTAAGAFLGGYFGNPQGGAAAGNALTSGF